MRVEDMLSEDKIILKKLYFCQILKESNGEREETPWGSKERKWEPTLLIRGEEWKEGSFT